MEGMQRAKNVGREQSVHALSRNSTLPKSPLIHQPGSFQNLSFWGFYGGFIILSRLIKVLVIGDWNQFQALLLYPEVGRGWTPITWLAPVAMSPYSKIHFKCHLINRVKILQSFTTFRKFQKFGEQLSQEP